MVPSAIATAQPWDRGTCTEVVARPQCAGLGVVGAQHHPAPAVPVDARHGRLEGATVSGNAWDS